MTRGDRERLRAELAGKAMQGILSCGESLSALTQISLDEGEEYDEMLFKVSIEYADGLLAELDRTAEDPIKAGGTE